jgi:hypothetical protein
VQHPRKLPPLLTVTLHPTQYIRAARRRVAIHELKTAVLPFYADRRGRLANTPAS